MKTGDKPSGDVWSLDTPLNRPKLRRNDERLRSQGLRAL